jgi:hypothetical protein
MASKNVIMRVSALSLMGGALLIAISEAGRLPGQSGAGAGNTPETHVMPAASAAGQDLQPVADAFANTQGLALPAHAGFLEAPVIAPQGWAIEWGAEERLVRPAAFTPAPGLRLPDNIETMPEADTDQAFSPLGLPCGLDVTVAALDHARIALGVAAPCQPETPVRIRHAGLTFGGTTDAVGLMTLDLPAFESPASVTVRLADGSEAEATVEIPDLAEYDRVALGWTGDLGLELHAMEAGAGWHAPGHVHPGARRGPEALAKGSGHLAELGTVAGFVQVYTRPRQGPAAESDVTISIDAPVTERTCTRSIAAFILRVEAGGPVDMIPIGLTYPACDAVGHTLVLQNALQDMRLAAN